MSDHEYALGRKAIREDPDGTVEGVACSVCGNLPDQCAGIRPAGIVEVQPQHDQGGTGGGTFQTVSGSPVSAPPPIKPRRQRRKRGA